MSFNIYIEFYYLNKQIASNSSFDIKKQKVLCDAS